MKRLSIWLHLKWTVTATVLSSFVSEAVLGFFGAELRTWRLKRAEHSFARPPNGASARTLGNGL